MNNGHELMTIKDQKMSNSIVMRKNKQVLSHASFLKTACFS